MGSQSINLDSGVPEEIELEDDVQTMDILMDEVQVPDSDTTYYCKLAQLPVFTETQYAVKFETVVEEGNEALVHHLVAYYCPEYIANKTHDTYEADCDDYSTNMPSLECRGSRILYVWAVGGAAVYMPEEAAMPLSGDSGLHYILFEIHYDVKCGISMYFFSPCRFVYILFCYISSIFCFPKESIRKVWIDRFIGIQDLLYTNCKGQRCWSDPIWISYIYFRSMDSRWT